MDELWIARHGATEWSRAGKHTGKTDLDLLQEGIAQARSLGTRLVYEPFDAIVTSPLTRARRTAELAGFGDRMEIDGDLVEWDYGDYEGLTTKEIRAIRPGWDLWRDGCPGGESLDDVSARAEDWLDRYAHHKVVLAFSHGHMLRVLAARWLDLTEAASRLGSVEAGALCRLAHERGRPVLKKFNEVPD